MDPPPPPPPPHGANQQNGKSGGLPAGKYDIFVIPPHSAGSGFLYLPSLSTHRNSFLAGSVCTAFAFFVYSVAVPVVKEYFRSTIAGGGSGVMALMMGVGVICWAWGKTQAEWSSGTTPAGSGGGGGTAGAGGTFGGHTAGSQPSSSAPPPGSAPPPSSAPPPGSAPPPNSGPPPGSVPPHNATPPNGGAGPKYWQRPNPQATGSTGANSSAKTNWEKAREETRRKEEERRRTEEAKRRREEAEKERQKQRERDAREKEFRERKERREREQREKEQKEKEEKEREEREKVERERIEREKMEREVVERVKMEREKMERERMEKERTEKERMEKERTEKERIEKERVEREKEKERQKAASEAVKDRSSPKRPPNPSVRTEKEDDAYSFRPYDRPKKPVHKANSAASMYSESSYAPSQSTARTTPPPVHRGPYATKDPDKIIIKAVYSFNNTFMRTPIAQLISGSGNVTDGLILRITTEGLFIDDDVRGVPQREWDIKAWTMKLAEVWCPNFIQGPSSAGSSTRNAPQSRSSVQSFGEVSAFLRGLSEACTSNCCKMPCSESESSHRTFSRTTTTSCSAADSSTSFGADENVTQSGEMMGLHVLRASIRDQEGKKYVFVLSQSEGWKVAIGLQRLRRGTQVRALGVSGLPPNETKMLIENLGWA
jgi:hypothetical protein